MSRFPPHILGRLAVAAALLAAVLAAPPAPAQDEADPAAATPSRPRRTRLQGKTFLDRTTDVVGATITVRREGDPSRIWLTSTGEDGDFRIDDLPDGGYEVGIEREGLLPVAKSGVELKFPFRAVVEVMMQRGQADSAEARAGGSARVAGDYPVSGVVASSKGEALADVQLRFESLDRRDDDPRIFRSGDDGTFELTQLPAGTWEVSIAGVGYLPIRSRLWLSSETTLHVTLVSQPADYVASPLELMPVEQLIPPDSLELQPRWGLGE